MTITKALESEIKLFLDNYWKTYFEGDLETWSTYITNDYKNIGGTEEEIWNSKQEIIDYTKAIIDQMIGAAEIRNKQTQVFSLAPFVLAHEFMDMYIKVENEWTFYGKFRLSSILKKGETGWQVVHQHGSYPDSKTEQGEAFAFDKISTENKQLKDAIKRRTLELENKNRELEIEASLERVRTVAMSMHKPGDLLNICQVLFNELMVLGFKDIRNALIHIFNDEKGFYYDYDYSDFTGGKITHLLYKGNATMEDFLTQIRKSDDAFVEVVFDGKELKDWKEFRKESGQLDDKRIDAANQLNYYFYSFGAGNIGFSNFGPVGNDKVEILKRFRNVFDFSYRRYLDLEKAEAQAREAQIEIGLERVRSRSLAMHHTSELQDVIHTVHKELLNLNIAANGGSFISINSDIETTLHCWGSGGTADTSEEVHLPFYEKPFCTNLIHGIKNGPGFFTEEFTQQEKKEFFTFLFKHEPWSLLDDKHKKEILSSSGGYTRSCCVSEHTSIFIINHFGEKFSDEDNDILKRFGKVFEQTYTRFLDLQNAEAQAREAQIEAALERVRSRSMAMQKSEELKDVIKTVYQQLIHLKINLEHAGFVVDYKPGGDWHFWIADDQDIPSKISHPYFDSVWANQFNEAKEKGSDFFTTNLNFEEKNQFYNELLSYVPGLPEASRDFYLTCNGLAASTVLFNNVSLYIENFSGIPFTDEENNTLMRFGKVFQQTYTRFLDLQKAEAQAREAQIEASLERLRSKTMAMHNSKDVGETVAVMFDELVKLGIDKTIRCGIAIIDDSKHMEVWRASVNAKGETGITVGILDMNIHPLLMHLHDVWTKKESSYTHELKGENLSSYYKALNSSPGYPAKFDIASLPSREINSAFLFKEGALFTFSHEPLSEPTAQILRKFSGVFAQTYRRYLDLQKAEAQAKESQIETALERVRSRTLAMQRSDELAETAAVLFKQLINLGIAPNRLYIGIVKDDIGHIEFWVTDEDGSKVSTQFIADVNRNASIKKMYDAWKAEHKSLSIDMHGKELENYFQYLSKELHVPFKQGLSQKRRMQTVAFFGKGFIGIASPDEQPEETTFLLERFASVFNLTYTRFNDLKVAEAHAVQAKQDLLQLKAEKKRAEDALNELQSAQKQLIQAEKMASLGELTAGIAHEIQNPLNFVNNFAEVNAELIEELKSEKLKPKSDRDDHVEESLLNDIVANLEKINHHGKRADAIVKGMLQHSRSSNATKQPTDINKLADEYLRLAYHGLRAKDKSFNATLETDYDQHIGDIDIIPQDIGRVILNLITNAFYAATLKRSSEVGGVKHSPTVWVSTKKLNGKVLISVRDNGPGIPKKILDKIFQPFFTTKPTGQGTGLGLSLSYDIVKAHAGELKVETKEGQGSKFTMQLPFSEPRFK